MDLNNSPQDLNPLPTCQMNVKHDREVKVKPEVGCLWATLALATLAGLEGHLAFCLSLVWFTVRAEGGRA